MTEVLQASKNNENSQQQTPINDENIGQVQVSYKKYEQMIKIIKRLQKLIQKHQKQGKSLCISELQDNYVEADQIDKLNQKYKKIHTQLDFQQQECAIAQLVNEKQIKIFKLRQENAFLLKEIESKHKQLHQQMWILDQMQ